MNSVGSEKIEVEETQWNPKLPDVLITQVGMGILACIIQHLLFSKGSG